jgi:hypothetical protein
VVDGMRTVRVLPLVAGSWAILRVLYRTVFDQQPKGPPVAPTLLPQRTRPTRLLLALTCIGVVLVLMGVRAVGSAADTPDPIVPLNASVVVNPDGSKTVSVDGSWQWTTHRTDCNTDRFAVGWAVDWNDPAQPGNVVGTVNNVTVDVGAAAANAYNPADNAVHYYPGPVPARCGVFGPHGATSYNTGNWGPVVHTYGADATDIEVCVVMYDIHNAGGKGGGPKKHGPKKDEPKKPGPKGGGAGGTAGPKLTDLVAGGAGHNHDNSVQDNEDTPLGNQCTLVPVTIPTTSTSTTTTTEPTTTTMGN